MVKAVLATCDEDGDETLSLVGKKKRKKLRQRQQPVMKLARKHCHW